MSGATLPPVAPTLPRRVCKMPLCGYEAEPNLDYCRSHEGGFTGGPGRTETDKAVRERTQETVNKLVDRINKEEAHVRPGPGVKYDAGKPRYDLLPPRALLEFVLVLTFGAKKYTANGWKAVVGWRWRYARAALTHVFRYLAGEAKDPETGLHHLAHAMCCVVFMLDNELALEAGVTTVPDGDTEDVVQPVAPVHVTVPVSSTTGLSKCTSTMHVFAGVGPGRTGCLCGAFR